MDKKDLRLSLKGVLDKMPIEERVRDSKTLSLNLFNHLLQISTSLESVVIGVYAPLPDEADWTLSSQLSSLTTAFPVSIGNGLMDFHQCHVKDLVSQKAFGVNLRIPPSGSPKVLPDIVLVPGLGFTKEGHRLGRGGGYYDRWLESFKGKKIGLCFEQQLLQTLPTEQHDIKVHAVVTQKQVWLS